MIGLLAFILRIALLAAFTFAFVVLFEYGPADFAKGAPQEWKSFAEFVNVKTGVSLPLAGEPAPTP